MVGKVRDQRETGSAGGMTTSLTWIAGLSSQLQSSLLLSTTIHTAVEQLDCTGQLQLTLSRAQCTQWTAHHNQCACMHNNYWGEPHTGQTASPAMFICLYLCLYRTSFRKCPRILIHYMDSFNFAQCVIKLAPQCLTFFQLSNKNYNTSLNEYYYYWEKVVRCKPDQPDRWRSTALTCFCSFFIDLQTL